ncbi:o-succinylbenzoate synthase [Mesobacillus zeae]|uniref:o-succinylbenzoate synthase n=2 Tax=Mesobacillus zeae TaxID=1917180 RepID=A0A398B0D0_9BACI|nr:o-succinylbenzoate synthase [Mesobacillus zeae]
MPLKVPFSTHLETVSEREGIIVEVTGKDGSKGCGEGVAFSSPWYTEETVSTSWHMLKDFLIPLLKKRTPEHLGETEKLFSFFRRNHMAKAAIESALWDLEARRKGLSLSAFLGGCGGSIPSGVVVGTPNIKAAVGQIETFLDKGYTRVKIKISPENDVAFVAEIRRQFPNLDLMADANSAYTLEDVDKLKALDEYGLMMIEQPLGNDDIVDHASLQKKISTPICLDESIVSLDDAVKAIKLGSCRVINIKPGRVGGLGPAKKIHDYCRKHHIPVWCGGMIEFGVSRAHNVALASLPGFTIPGDISGSDRYWEKDIITPEIVVEKGRIKIPERPGLGFDLDFRRLKEVTLAQEEFMFE